MAISLPVPILEFKLGEGASRTSDILEASNYKALSKGGVDKGMMMKRIRVAMAPFDYDVWVLFIIFHGSMLL